MNPKIRNELIVAYLQTEYSIDLPDRQLWISPVSDNLEFREYFIKHRVLNWALITPFNPRSVFLSDEENLVRLEKFENEELVSKQLAKNKDYFGSVSRPKDTQVKGERGFWICNCIPGDAVRVGHKWGQNAILIGRADGYVELQWCEQESPVYLNRAKK